MAENKTPKTQGAEPKESEAPKIKEYYIVNPSGTVHSVEREHMRDLLAKVGYRKATADEIELCKSRKTQTLKNRIAKPHSTDPDEED